MGSSANTETTNFNAASPSSNHNNPPTTVAASNPNHTPSELDSSKKRRTGMLPLEVGTRVSCLWRDGKYHPVKVIERRKNHSDGNNEYEYYVHYTEFNRRLDEWIRLDQLDLDSVECALDEKVEDKVTSLKMTRHQKRKIDETHVEELSDMTAIKAEDILSTLQSLELIQYRKGQHVICADPKVLDRHLKAAGRGGLDVDVSKMIWTPYKEQS
ncbi:hypothetical protein F2Q69_00040160 [Brassica cretica]|uniref:histone acetyltransferase n=1 Tax=Brassica cretica TaxID=69181 RepID=A0A8S9NI84_BRACR|nr:hypothetical protein F2Q69_00040160 [Brassica cretica]